MQNDLLILFHKDSAGKVVWFNHIMTSLFYTIWQLQAKNTTA